jgi:hypothetical protein
MKSSASDHQCYRGGDAEYLVLDPASKPQTSKGFLVEVRPTSHTGRIRESGALKGVTRDLKLIPLLTRTSPPISADRLLRRDKLPNYSKINKDIHQLIIIP